MQLILIGQVTGYMTHYIVYRLQATVYCLLATGYWLLATDTGYWLLLHDTVYRLQATGYTGCTFHIWFEVVSIRLQTTQKQQSCLRRNHNLSINFINRYLVVITCVTLHIHCTVYIVQCTVYNAQCTMFIQYIHGVFGKFENVEANFSEYICTRT